MAGFHHWSGLLFVTLMPCPDLFPVCFCLRHCPSVRPRDGSSVHYLCPITNIHLNIASNSIPCIQHLRMSTPRHSGALPRYLLGLWPSEPFAGTGEISKYVEWSLPRSYRPYLHLYIQTQGSNYVITEAIRGLLT